jgi:hypothetical protein
MPRNLCLKSWASPPASPSPEPGVRVAHWLARHELETLEPISYADFTEYGLWLQRQLVPDVQPVNVATVRPITEGAEAVELASGEAGRAPARGRRRGAPK